MAVHDAKADPCQDVEVATRECILERILEQTVYVTVRPNSIVLGG